MADLADIETAIVAQVARVLFTAPYTPGAMQASAAGVSVKLYRGWPEAAQLDTDLAAGAAHVTVYSDPGMARVTTRYRPEWFIPVATLATLSAAVAGAAVTFGGTGGAGQVATVAWGNTAAPQTASYRLVAGDTPTSVATALAGLISGAAAAGAVLTIPTATLVTAQAVSDVMALREVRRQEQGFRVSCWCPTPKARDAIVALVDQAFASMTTAGGAITDFLALPNAETARFRYKATYPNDVPTKDRLWRRDILLTVEYATTVAQAQPIMTAPVSTLAPNGMAMPAQIVTITAPAKPTIGAIRFDAWYSTDALSQAVAADLSPPQFNYRAPFFASITGGAVSFNGNLQSVMDMEIAAAKAGKVDYWAFLSQPAGAQENNALNLYLSSAIRSLVGFCMLVNTSDIWFQGAGYSAEMMADIALTGHAGYQTVLDSRPLLYLLDSGDADLIYRFGSLRQFGVIVADIRARIFTLTGKTPYLAILSSDPVRCAAMVRAYGFDAGSAYATPGANVTPQPYSALVAVTEAWWGQLIGQGAQLIPPIMTGWCPLPRIVTPNALFGSESAGNPLAYYADPTPAQIGAHALDAVNWLRANRASAPAQTALIYAWNEFDEGGWLCPTYLSGNAAGDNSRLTALAAALP